jgi:predicted AlkP superfamily pyrophosphatase or phosphodiesterase
MLAPCAARGYGTVSFTGKKIAASARAGRGSMRRRTVPVHTLLALLVTLIAATTGFSQQLSPIITVDHGPNASSQLGKHYVVLVSLDGFRYDYAKKYGARHILELAKSGASAPEGMLPSYPSITFPNHYTIVTGLYPEHHGIIANSFYDPVRKQKYASNDASSVTDGSWYGGTPLWSLAEKAGMRSACFFWPGSEAEIAGERPSYYLKYEDAFPDEKRIDQVLAWLALPEEQRPHFITLYYPNADQAGHEFGPDTPQTRDAVRHLDALIGELSQRLNKTHLPIDLIVLSDHGMEATKGDWISLDKIADLSGFITTGPLLYGPSEAATEKAYQQLKSASGDFKVYRRAHVPAVLDYDQNAREGDPVIVPTGPYSIRARAPIAGARDYPPNKGAHGYDPREMPSMRAIFYAAGPDIRKGSTLRPFENVNIYPFIAALLQLDAPASDGKLSVLEGILKAPPAEPVH